MSSEKSENRFGMRFGESPHDIRSIRLQFAETEVERVVFEAEKYMREVVAGNRAIGDEPVVFKSPGVIDFLTAERVEFGGRSILASLREVVSREMANGVFVEPDEIPRPNSTWQVAETDLVEFVPAEIKPPKKPRRTRRSLLRGTSEGREWVGINHFLGIGIPHRIVREILSDVPSRSKSWGSTKFQVYERVLAEEKLRAYMESRPKIDGESGHFTDEAAHWVNIQQLVDRFGISNALVQKLLKDVPSRPGRGKLGKETTLYDELVASKILGDYKLIPNSDTKTGIITQNGSVWTPIGLIIKRLGTSYVIVKPLLDSTDFITARSRKGKVVKFYREAAIREALSGVLSTPRVGSPEAKQLGLVDAKHLSRIYRVHPNTIQRRLKRIAVNARGKNGKPSSLYNIQFVEEILGLPNVSN